MRTFVTSREQPAPPLDGQILAEWRMGKDTFEIAQRFWVAESNIANRLPHILERARQDQEWNFDRLVTANDGRQCA